MATLWGMVTKICCRCKGDKPLTEYGKLSSRPDGLNYRCRQCERERAESRRRSQGRPVRELLAASDMFRECRECKKVFSIDNFGKYSALPGGRHYYCKKCVRARTQGYRDANKELVRQSYAKWYLGKDKAYFVNLVGVRRDRKVNNGSFTVTQRDLKRLLARQGSLCVICGIEMSNKTMHLDHVIPIARGGRHGIGNLQYLCASCNLRKNTKFMTELKGVS